MQTSSSEESPASPKPHNDFFVDLQHVSVRRASSTVLHDISLQIRAGEHLAILGPNGCGKSTLLKTLTCELYPLATPEMRLRIFGRDRWDVTELRRMLGVVSADPPAPSMLECTGFEAVLTGFFSSAQLWPHLTVTGEMRERAHAVLREVNATELTTRKLVTMSAGQQRRILIARALVASGYRDGRRVLLLDEPSNALDFAAQQDLSTTLQNLALRGTGLVLITHRLQDIVPEIDRIVCMRDGIIIADGPKQAMLTTNRLRQLFGVDLHLSTRDGFFHAW